MAIILSFLLIIGIFPFNRVYSEKGFEKNLEDITSKMKKLFDITHDYENFDSEVSTYDNVIRYYLSWSDSSKDIPDISIEVDKNENIISYYKNYKDKDQDKTNSIGIKEAEKLALEFIKDIGGKTEKQIIKADTRNVDPGYSSYGLEFYRQVDGIVFYGNMLQLNVDKYRGEVLSYNSNWDYNIEFPDKNKAMEKEKIKKIFEDKLGLELIYKSKYNGYPRRAENPEFYLVYGFLDRDKALDAISGEVVSVNRYGTMDGGFGGSDAKEEMAETSGLTPEERKEIEKLSGIMGKDEIEKTAREILALDKGYKLTNTNLYSSWKNKDEFLWSLYFETEGEDYKASNITLNAKTDELISFYKNQDYEGNKDKKSTINREEALEIANNYLKKTVPQKADKIEYIENAFDENDKSYNFNFIRKEGDIYIEDDYISVGVNAIDKSIFSYDLNWYNGKIPSKGQIITMDKAYDILYDKVGYELFYIKAYDRNINMERQMENKVKIKLVYDVPLNRPVNIEAKSGKLLDYSGDEYIPPREIEYSDLENSYARDKIKTLAEYGIGFNEGEFKPKDKIIQKDFAYLLWRAVNPYGESIVDLDKIYEELINRGIVKENEKAPNNPMAKEEAVAFIIRAMNYEEVAKLKGIYKNVFADSKDIKEEYIGHINLAYGFKIIQGDGGNPPRLNPKNKLTREDAGNIIYNYIFR